ncbi:transposase [Paenibacillus sp. sgz500958]|uniref:transposase n=1 Tax=Paenibacillus sp. sgz500958 TaxID=3242475 RepID=UPI0036D27335
MPTCTRSHSTSYAASGLFPTRVCFTALTVPSLQAGIGDIKRFPPVKQLTAFAGLESSVYGSGTFKSNHNHISKRGSSYLRTALYQATVAGISKQVNGPSLRVVFYGL